MAALDASALLAWVHAENGHEYVADYPDNGIISGDEVVGVDDLTALFGR